MSVSVCSEQSCVNQTRPTTTINLGSSQPREGGRVRASQSSSPPRKRTRRTEVPDILISGVEEAEEEWKKMADEMEETSHRAKQREKKKRAKKARVITKINFIYCMRYVSSAEAVAGCYRHVPCWDQVPVVGLRQPQPPAQARHGRRARGEGAQVTNEGAAAGHVTSILLSDWLRFEDIRDIDDPQHWADILATKVGGGGAKIQSF